MKYWDGTASIRLYWMKSVAPDASTLVKFAVTKILWLSLVKYMQNLPFKSPIDYSRKGAGKT